MESAAHCHSLVHEQTTPSNSMTNGCSSEVNRAEHSCHCYMTAQEEIKKVERRRNFGGNRQTGSTSLLMCDAEVLDVHGIEGKEAML